MLRTSLLTTEKVWQKFKTEQGAVIYPCAVPTLPCSGNWQACKTVKGPIAEVKILGKRGKSAHLIF